MKAFQFNNMLSFLGKQSVAALSCAFLLPLMVQCQTKEQPAQVNKPEQASLIQTGNPAMPGFNAESSDTLAIEIADKIMENMGGYKAWDDTRFIAWSFYGQYNIWDKHEGFFRHEKDGQVTLLNLNKPEGKLFRKGMEVTDEQTLKQQLEIAYLLWANNSYFLAMPYKLKDTGVTLKYKGESQTVVDGKPADVLELTFDKVGVSPYNKHQVWVDKASGLVSQWAFYGQANDSIPSFVRRWADYETYGKLKFSTNRDSENDNLRITDLVVTNEIPEQLFYSTTPINKKLIK